LVVVTGGDDALNAVTSVLARAGIVAQQLRVDQSSLEDAFVALTGHHPGTHEPGADGPGAGEPGAGQSAGEPAGHRN
jgi:ABC-2 type transport system ATP-binding protein